MYILYGYILFGDLCSDFVTFFSEDMDPNSTTHDKGVNSTALKSKNIKIFVLQVFL